MAKNIHNPAIETRTDRDADESLRMADLAGSPMCINAMKC